MLKRLREVIIGKPVPKYEIILLGNSKYIVKYDGHKITTNRVDAFYNMDSIEECENSIKEHKAERFRNKLSNAEILIKTIKG